MLHLLPLSTLLLITPILSSPISKSDPLPLVIWHGLGDNYAADGLQSVGDLAEEVNAGTYVYFIRIDENPDSDRTASFFGNLTDQIASVCAALAEHPILSTAPGINALGFSQGGQFLRGYVERCNNPPVKNLVTFGSQHNGIAKYQVCDEGDWFCKIKVGVLKRNTWSDYVQARLVPAQYFRTVDEETGEPSDEYLEYSNFLADVNNERTQKNSTYAKNLASLEKFVMYVFEDDDVVIPRDSGWFAQVNTTSGETTPLRERTIYKEDWIGLKALDKKGGLEFKTTSGNHMQLNDDDLRDTFATYFAPPKASRKQASGWEEIGEAVQELIEL